MAKIVLSKGDTVIQEMVIRKERVTIGRSAQNDMIINDIAVSGQHAVIVTLNHDSFLEDMNSTNGTKVNGQPVKKHFLQHADSIRLAHYTITYLEETSEAANFDRVITVSGRTPVIKVLSGPRAGKEITLNDVLTTVGKPGESVMLISKCNDGHYLTSVEGGESLSVNGRQIAGEAMRLNNWDVIELSGVRLQFLLGDKIVP